MNIAFHTGKSAMIAQGKALDIYGNNIANINTVGYQTIRPDFADCIYDTSRAPEADWQTGHGTYIQKTDLMFSESFFNETDRPQDMAIAGEGFFAVQDRWGNVNYTRDGKFGLTQLDGVWYLVSSQGEYVLDYDKNRIEVPFEEMSKNDILSRLDWNTISGLIGTFTSNDVQTNRLRYTYNGDINSDTPTRNPDAVKTLTPSTEDPTSAMITTADGYFAVMDKYGNITYTRDEQLSIQEYEGKWYLGSTSGDFVLDSNNKRIEITEYLVSEDFPDLERVQRDPDNEELIAVQTADGAIEFREVTEFKLVKVGSSWYLQTMDGENVLDENDRPIISSNVEAGNYFRVNWNDDITDRVGVFTFAPGELSTNDKTRYNIAAAADENIEKFTGDDMLSHITLGNNEGFFAVEGQNGIRYVHDINFDIMRGDDGNWYLSTPQGEYVLDYNNQRIQVSEALLTGNVDWAGVHDAVGVFVFPNPYGIDALGSNRYLETNRSGDAVADRNMAKIPYALIASNVNLADQMVKLIETQRSYQLSSRVVTTADELAQISNNLR